MTGGPVLADVCSAIVDCEHKTAPIDPDGEYFAVGTPAMRGNRINFAEARQVSRETFDGWTRRLSPEEGDLLLAREAPVGPVVRIPPALNVAPGQRTVLLRPDPTQLDSGFAYYLLASPQQQARLRANAEGSTVPHLNVADVRSFELPPLPPLDEQRGIASTLGMLDDKIESNRNARNIIRQLGRAGVAAALSSGSRRPVPLADLTTSISRGVTPKYADDDPTAPLVINQKCVRDNWVSTEPARRMTCREVPQAKIVGGGDVLVNSTGAGTLGRIGRWHSGTVFADSHVTIVKADSAEVGPTLLAYLLFDRQSEVESMATGSTGQTELSPTRLGELVVEVPADKGLASDLEGLLLSMEDRAASLRDEEDHLVLLRDALLPWLLSGRIRVPEAEQAMAEAGA